MTVAGRRAIIGALMVAVGAFACTGGGSSFGTSASGGGSSSGSVGGVGSEPLPPAPGNPGSPPPEPSEVPVPFVECIPAPPDAGEDADVPDASNGDAGASPCEAPPQPSCLDKTSMVEWGAGPCIDYACAFVADVIACPGGCFRQLDGGEHCNRK